MNRSNGALWEYFERSDNNTKLAKYIICSNKYSYKTSITNLKNHLKTKHLFAYERMFAIQEIRNQSTESQNEESATSVSSNFVDAAPRRNPLSSSATGSGNQGLESNYSSNLPILQVTIPQEIKRKIDADLLDLFIDSYQPFSIVEERAFKKFASWIPGYKLPTRKTVSETMITKLYEKTKENNKKDLDNISNICVTADMWTSTVTDSYLGVTGHFITDDWKLKTFLLDCAYFPEKHTSDNIKQKLSEITDEWNVSSKINFAVTDNAANVKKAIQDLGWKHYGCYAHTLNLIVQDSLKIVKERLEKVKRIVRYFKTSHVATEKLLKSQINENPDRVPLRLIQEVPTRWNSTFFMLRRFVLLETHIRLILAIVSIDLLPTITSDDWKLYEELCKVLDPFAEITKTMSAEKYVTASLIIPLTRSLKLSCETHLLESYGEITKNVISALITGIDSRFKGIEKSSTFAICTLLDPRYKMDVFCDNSEASKARKNIEGLVTSMINQV